MPVKDLGPATPSQAYLQMELRWRKIQTLLDGTEAMRLAEREYLPQHEGESNWAYAERLQRSTLLNMTKMTLDSWVGKPFSAKIKVGEDVPDEIDNLFTNVDLQGNDLNVYSRNWFREGVAKGFCHTLVEFPRPQPRPDGKPRTLADDQQQKLRPYFVKIAPENLIFAHAIVVDGVEVCDHVRIQEQHVEVVGFSEVVVNRIREMVPGQVTIYKQVPDEKRRNKMKWVIEEQYPYGLPFIPLVTYYAEREGFMLSNPPIEDLADLNIAHWQSDSDQTAILTVCRFPVVCVSGAMSDANLTIGPHAWLNCPDPAGRYYYLEHSGKAIASGHTDLETKKEQMAEYGAIFLIKRPGGATATANALKTAEVTSPLQDMTIRFQAALNEAIALLGKWMKIDETGTVQVNTDFGMEPGDLPHLTALGAARIQKDLSRVQYVRELHRFGVLGEEFDPDQNNTELLQEMEDQAKQVAQGLLVQPLPPAVPPGGAAKPPGGGGSPSGSAP